MKKNLCIILSTFLIIFTFVGCKVTDESGAFQELSDRTYIAKDFATDQFEEYMKDQNKKDYKVEQTNYGFIATENEPTYIVGIKYSANNSLDYYSYKIQVNDDMSCKILKEGSDIASFILFD